MALCRPPQALFSAAPDGALRLVGRLAVSLLLAFLWIATGSPALAAEKPGTPAQRAAVYGRLPLGFEPNMGQVGGQAGSSVKFLSRGRGYTLFLTSSETVLGMRNQNRQPTVLRMKLVGANAAPQTAGLEPLPGKSHYFLGNDPARWHTDVPHYARVRQHGVYPGVDLFYYGNQGKLEYDFVVHSGADPRAIGIALEGADSLALDSQGHLVLSSRGGRVVLRRPRVYQEVDGVKRSIWARYVLRGPRHVGFEIAAYDVRRPLVIDPVLEYSTYLGGSGEDAGTGIAVDAAGNAYVAGSTASVDFPATNGLQSASGGSSDVFVTKLNGDGSAVVYSTYLGGSGADQGAGIAVDGAGNVYVTGVTSSADFPLAHPLQGVLGGGQDAFVAKLNADGSALVYSTYLGGSASDQGAGIAVDGVGNLYLTGSTASSDFPVTAQAFQPKFGGGASDAFLAKLNPEGTALVYSSFLGGSGPDRGNGIAVDGAGSAYVAGETDSANYPTAVPLQAASGGGRDAFVAKVDTSRIGVASLVYSTYLGGSGSDRGRGIAVDASGNAFVTGGTDSANFPMVAAFQAACKTKASGECTTDAFLSELRADGSGLVFSTYLGGSGTDEGQAIAVDGSGSAYVTGRTDSADFPNKNAKQAACVLDPTTKQCSAEAFVSKFEADGSALVYSTYLGGSGSDQGNAIAADDVGSAFVAGQTTSGDFPTAHPLQGTLAGVSDAFVAKIADPDAKKKNNKRRVAGCPGTIHWVAPGPAPAPWEIPINWLDNSSVNRLPGASDDVCIDGGNAVFSASTGTVTITSLTVTNTSAITGGGGLNISGGSLTIQSTTSTSSFSSPSAPGNLTLSGGTLSVAGALSLNSVTTFNLSGGTLTGGGTVTANGGISWTAGAMTGSGTTNIPSGATLTISTGPVNLQRHLDISASGTVNWNSGTIQTSGALIDNRTGANWNAQSDDSLSFSGTATTFNNAGTFTKSVGSTATTVGVIFNNTGTVSVISATLDLTAGGTSSGTFSVPGSFGAALEFAGGTHTLNNGASLNSAPGPIRLTTGILDVAGTVSQSGTFEFTGGTLQGVGTLTINGTMNWTAGTMSGTGGVTSIASGAFLNISGTTTKTFSQRTITNSGTTTWTDGQISSGNGATFNNQSGAIFDVQADLNWLYNLGGTVPVFSNSGTFKKTFFLPAGRGGGGRAGSAPRPNPAAAPGTFRSPGTTTIAITVNNNSTGTVSVQDGTLSLTGGGSSAGALDTTSPNILQFNGSTYTLNTGTTVTGSGTVQVAGGTLDVAASVNVPNTVIFELVGGTLQGTGTLTVNGVMNWTGGTMSGAGTTSIAASTGSLNISTTTTKTLSQRTLTNSGFVSWVDGQISTGNGAVINNQSGANFYVQGTLNMLYNLGGTATQFNNAGTFVMTEVTGTVTIGVIFNNTGFVSVQTGTLVLSGGGTSTGNFDVSSGTTLIFDTGTHTLNTGATLTGTAFAGPGLIKVAGGTLSVAASVSVSSVPTFELAGGTLTGAGTLTVNGVMNWTGGTMNGAGATTFPVSSALNISSATTKTLSQRTINNSATVTWSAGQINTGNGAIINNQSGANWNTQSDDGLLYNLGGTATVFSNAGTFTKQSGAATQTVGVTFNNTGTVSVISATLDLTGGGTSTGSFSVPGSIAALEFAGGTHILNTGATLSSAPGPIRLTSGTLDVAASVSESGTFELTGGTLQGVGTLTINGTMNWTGGTMSGTGGVTSIAPSTGALNISTTTTKTLSQRTISNSGTTTWTGGQINSGNGAIFNNLSGAVFDAQVDQGFNYNLGGTATVFTNAGTLKKSAGTGTLTLFITLNNSNAVQVQSGTLSLAGGGTNTGSFTTASTTALVFNSNPYTLSTGTTLAGTGLYQVATGALDVAAAVSVSTTFELAATLQGVGTLTVTGTTMNWTGGTMTGAGATTISSGAALNISTTTTKTFSQRTINNSGTTTWTGGQINSGNGAVFNNLAGAIFDAQVDQGFFYNAGGTATVFSNSGTVKKTAGTATTEISAAFNNSATVTVQAATLKLSGGGTSGGSFAANTGTVLEFGGGTHFTSVTSGVSGAGTVRFSSGQVDLVGSYAVTGTTEITGGTVNFNATASTTNGLLSAGTLGGTGTLTVSGTMSWTGGTMTTTAGGITSIALGAALNISGTGTKTFTTRTINNSGTVTWTGGQVNTGSVATFNNVTSTAVFDAQVDAGWFFNLGGSAPVFTNAGIVKKTAGTATTEIGVAFNNNTGGTVTVTAATLKLSGGGTSAGSFAASTGAVLEFGGGTHTLTAGSGVSGAGTVRVSSGQADLAGSYAVTGTTEITGGTANFNATASTVGALLSAGTLAGTTAVLTVSGTMSWTGGTMTGAGQTAFSSGAALNISGTSTKTFTQRAINSSGTTTWSGGQINSGGGALFNNLSGGIFDAQVDAGFFFNLGGSATQFTNAGTAKKTAGTGTTTLGIAFDNISGTVTVQSGTLSLAGGTLAGSGTSSSAGFTTAAGAVLDFGGGTHTMGAASSVSGAGTVRFSSGSVSLAGSYAVTGTTEITGGTANFNATASTVGGLLSAGTLGGTAALTVSGTMSWTGGTMTGAGITSISSGGALNISGTSTKTFTQRTISNSGTTTWTGGQVNTGSVASFINDISAIFDAQVDAGWFFNLGGTAPVFTNAGIVKKTAGTATTEIGIAFNNNGTVTGQAATLKLSGGGSSGGSFAASTGAVVEFGGGTHTLNAASGVSGAGTVRFSSGQVDLAGSYAVTGTTEITGGTANFNATASTTGGLLSAGTLGGTGTLTVNGPMSWTGGTMTSSAGGITSIASGAALNISGTSTKTFTVRTINNSGTVTWSGGQVNTGSLATFNNQATGIFDAQVDAGWFFNLGGTAPLLTNAGTVKKTAGTATTEMGVAFNNSGTVTAQAATLKLSGGGSSAGSFAASTGAVLEFGGGTHTLTASSGVSGAGTVRFSSGQVDMVGSYAVTGTTEVTGGTANFNATASTTNGLLSAGALGGIGTLAVNGTMSWTGGTMTSGAGGITNIASGAALNISGTSTKTFTVRTINNSGTVTWSGGQVNTGSVATFNNQATGIFDAQVDAGWLFNLGGTPSLFTNAGIVKKTAGTATTDMGVAFSNSGSVLGQAGVISFSGGFTQTAGSTVLNGGNIFVSGTMNINGGSLSGVGTVTGNVSSSGLVSPGLSAGVLTISGNYTQSSTGSLVIEIGGTNAGTDFDLLNVSGTATLSGTLTAGFINAFLPLTGTTFQVMNCVSCTGAFTTVSGPLSASVTSTAVILTTVGGTNPVPTVSSISPTSTTAGGPAFTLTVNGSNFVVGSVVNWNGSSRSTTFVSSSQLTASILNTDIATAGTAQVTVVNPAPGGGTSNAFTFTINPAADLALVKTGSPSPAIVGSNLTYTLTVSNSGPSSASGVTVTDTLPAGVTFVSASASQGACSGTSTVTCTLGSLASGSSATVSIVVTPTAAGSISNTASVIAAEVDPNTINNSVTVATTVTAPNPLPTLTSLSPSSALGGGAAFTLTVNGGNFVLGSVVNWNGSPRSTAFVSSSQLTAAILASDIASPGIAQITVFNPSPGGGTSNALSFIINSATCTTAPSGLVSWWPAEANANDFVGTNNGTLVGGATFGAGEVGQAFSFNGSSAFVSVPDSALWAFGASDFTVSLWANFNSVPASTIGNPAAIFIGNDEGRGNLNKWFFALGGGLLNFAINSPSIGPKFLAQAAFSPVLGRWYHLAVTRTGSTYRIYVDGSQVSSETNTDVIPDANAPLTIGQAESLGFMNGLLDEVQIHNRALSASEIQAIVIAGSAGQCKTYLVGDTFPIVSGDHAGQFGDGVLNNLDLVNGLRAVTGVTGFVPLSCSDRFDAIDADPEDGTSRGGNGILDTLDLIVTLRRVVNINTTRPTRVARGLCLLGQVEPLAVREEAGRSGPVDAGLELGPPQAGEGGVLRVPVYLEARRDLDLAGLSFAVGLTGEGRSLPLHFAAGDAGRPTLVDEALPGVVSVAWLEGLKAPVGQRVLLGYVVVRGVSQEVAASLEVIGAKANHKASGRGLGLSFPEPPAGPRVPREQLR